jgi:hypothetical protein
MANEISWRHSATGASLYFTIRRPTDGYYWSTPATANFVTLVAANWANYDIAMDESWAAGGYVYRGTFPAITGNMIAGWYYVDIFSGAVAITDTLVTTLFGYWDGTAFKRQGADVVQEAGRKIKVAGTDGDWATPGTWEDGAVPSAGDSIVIKSGVDVTVAASEDLGQFGPWTILGTLSIASGQTVAVVPEGCTITNNEGIITTNYGLVLVNNDTMTYNYGIVVTNSSGTIVLNLGVIKTNHDAVTQNAPQGEIHRNSVSGTVVTNNGTIEFNSGAVTNVGTGVILYGTGGVNTLILEDTGTTLPAAIPSASTIATAVAAQAVGSEPGSIGKGIADILDDTGTSGVVVKAASTVGAFPAAALVNAPTGSTITVSQTAAVGSIQAFNLETTQYGSPSLPITCSVSQQGDGHKFAIYPLDDFSTPTVTLGSSLCTVGASPYTTVTVALDDAYTATAGVFSYILRNTTDDIDAARGTLRIRPASNLTST